MTSFTNPSIPEFLEELKRNKFYLDANGETLTLQSDEEVSEKEIEAVAADDDIIGFIKKNKLELLAYCKRNSDLRQLLPAILQPFIN